MVFHIIRAKSKVNLLFYYTIKDVPEHERNFCTIQLKGYSNRKKNYKNACHRPDSRDKKKLYGMNEQKVYKTITIAVTWHVQSEFHLGAF